MLRTVILLLAFYGSLHASVLSNEDFSDDGLQNQDWKREDVQEWLLNYPLNSEDILHDRFPIKKGNNRKLYWRQLLKNENLGNARILGKGENFEGRQLIERILVHDRLIN